MPKRQWEAPVVVDICRLLDGLERCLGAHQGLRNQEIGEQFGISVRTVEAHAACILAKLGARSRTEAVNIAAESA